MYDIIISYILMIVGAILLVRSFTFKQIIAMWLYFAGTALYISIASTQ